MTPRPQATDPRREHLRMQAIQRRQAMFDRIAATRSIVVGGVVVATVVLVGYLDASAHPHVVSSSSGGFGSSFGTSGYSSGADSSNSSNDDSGSSSQSLSGGTPPSASSGGGTPPSASSGAGTVISGGS